MRKLDTATLDEVARFRAGEWLRPDIKSPGGNFVAGRSFVLQELYNGTFKDEHEYVVNGIKGWMGPQALADFEKAVGEKCTPRDDKVFANLLAEKLAITPDGKHIEGKIGTCVVGERIIGERLVSFQRPIVKPSDPDNPSADWRIVAYKGHVVPKKIRWPIYAGEEEERAAGRIKSKIGANEPGADPLPKESEAYASVSQLQQANNPNMSAALAIKLADLIDDEFNIGSTAAKIEGWSGAQPSDPDAANAGLKLFELTMSDPAFGAASDQGGTAQISAATITDDTNADNTATLSYCRCSATGTGADDVLDGEAGTSGADFNFNTLAIQSGATVSMTSFTVDVDQGTTAV